MPQKPKVDHSHGVGTEEDPDKRNQGGKDGRNNPNSNPVGRKAIDQSNRQLWGPFYSEAGRQNYWYDDRSDTLILQDGQAIPRPPSTPRSSLMLTSTRATLPQPNYSKPVAQLASQADSSIATPHGYRQPFNGEATLGALTTNLQSVTLNSRSDMSTSSTSSRIHVRSDSSRGVLELEDPVSQVQITFKDGPTNEITDSVLLQKGVQAKRLIDSPETDVQELLFNEYRRRKTSFFAAGRVIELLWIELESDAETHEYEHAYTRRGIGEIISSKIRRFIVIQAGQQQCSVVPVTVYRHGASNPGVSKSEHTIVHTSQSAPSPSAEESSVEGEPAMWALAIRVVPDNQTDKLSEMSRINYGEVYTIDHRVRVKPFGMVHEGSMATLLSQFNDVWRDKRFRHRPLSNSTAASTPDATYSGGRATDVQGRLQEAAPNSRPATIDHITPGLGPISVENMIILLRRAQEYAARNNLLMPPLNLNPTQIHTLAVDPARRIQYLQRILDTWKRQIYERDDDDDDDDDDDSDDDE